jgi:hypothetical protein
VFDIATLFVNDDGPVVLTVLVVLFVTVELLFTPTSRITVLFGFDVEGVHVVTVLDPSALIVTRTCESGPVTVIVFPSALIVVGRNVDAGTVPGGAACVSAEWSDP